MLLSTDVWVSALIRRAELGGAFAAVVMKGDSRAGSVLVKAVNRRTGETRLYAEAMRGEGESVWMQPRPGETDQALDQYAERARRIDPDLWLVEIEDVEGRHFLTEAVEDTSMPPPAWPPSRDTRD